MLIEDHFHFQRYWICQMLLISLLISFFHRYLICSNSCFFSVSVNLQTKFSKVVDIPQCLPAYICLTIFFLEGVGFAPMFASLSVWSGQIEHWIASPKAADIRYWILAKVLLRPACQTKGFKPVVFHSFSFKWLTNFITEDFYPDQTLESL